MNSIAEYEKINVPSKTAWYQVSQMQGSKQKIHVIRTTKWPAQKIWLGLRLNWTKLLEYTCNINVITLLDEYKNACCKVQSNMIVGTLSLDKWSFLTIATVRNHPFVSLNRIIQYTTHQFCIKCYLAKIGMAVICWNIFTIN